MEIDTELYTRDRDLYIIYIFNYYFWIFYFFILLYDFFRCYYYNYYVKFIVVSTTKNNKLKIHTEPLSITKALEIQKKLEDQYYYKGYKGEAFIIKFIKF